MSWCRGMLAERRGNGVALGRNEGTLGVTVLANALEHGRMLRALNKPAGAM